MNVSSSSGPAVDLLWVEMKPIINDVSENIDALLDVFAVSPAFHSCLCRQFDAVSELVDVHA